MLVIGEIDHADADGYRSVQWEIAVPRERMENTHGGGRYGEEWTSARDVPGTHWWRRSQPSFRTLHMSTKLARTGDSSTQEAAYFDQVGSVTDSPSRARRDPHYPSPLCLSPAPPRFADWIVWVRVKTRFRRAEAARETWGLGPFLAYQSMPGTSRADKDEGWLQTRPFVRSGTPMPHDRPFRLYFHSSHVCFARYSILALR